MQAHFLVIGAGQAGQSLVSKLRSLDRECRITLVGDEKAPPYQRPPLSKKYLLGEMELERLYLRPESYYANENIELLLGRPATGIDPVARTVTVGDEALSYDRLALTTGSLPRRLPASIGGALPGVYTVRTLADVDAMAAEFAAGRRLLVIGGGYIGLEAASVAARKGLKVTLVEMAPRILNRVAAAETSAYFRAAHGAEGVDVREGIGLVRLTGDTRVSGAVLTDGSEIATDFVVVGVGIAPDTRLAVAAGLAIDNGIATDAFLRTSDPAIFAAGDCASFPYDGARLRLESVGNAIDMGECAADNMLGAGRVYKPAPWFWSDQFDIKLQIAGLSTGYDRIVTRRGDGDAVSFWYFAGPRLIAVDAMNDSRAYMIGKRLIEAGRSPDPSVIADTTVDLKPLLKA